MELYYTDEHGTGYPPQKLHELAYISQGGKPKNPWYMLGMLTVPESLRFDTYKLVSTLKTTYLKPLSGTGFLHERSVESELKGARLFHRVNGNQHPHEIPMLDKLSQQDAISLVDGLINGLIGLGLKGSFYVVAVEQRALYRQYFRISRHAAFLALTFLQTRACLRLEFKFNQQAQVGSGGISFEHGAFIIDRGSAMEAQLDVFNFLATRDQISRSMNLKADYDRWLLENPVSVMSSDCPQLQLCDVLLYITAKAIETNGYKSPWFQKVLPLIASRGNGTISGIGLTFYPGGVGVIPGSFVGV